MGMRQTETEIQEYRVRENGAFPGNDRLPLILYSGAIEGDLRQPDRIEQLFRENGWQDTWVDGVYGYHHYHSTAHEVLGCCGGVATIEFGGPGGLQVHVHAGDVVVIPAGVAHNRLTADANFCVVGAYPPGQKYDLLKGEPGERPGADERIGKVSLPENDPIYGSEGPLIQIWKH